MLEVRNVRKVYTGHVALDDVSLRVPRGCIYGLLGPNGAGKTTLIRIINHITAPDSGEVVFDGHRLVAGDCRAIGYLPEERGLYKKMKVMEQAMFFARLKGLSKGDARREIEGWFERLGIMDWRDKKVEELSKGMAQKVQFVITVLHRPQLLIFDEPFSGFDPVNANMLKREILELRNQGATVIFSTHNMNSVEELCDEITLINKGQNILTGNVAEIRQQMGRDRYVFTYAADGSEAVHAALAPFMAEPPQAVESKLPGVASVSVRLAGAEALQPAVAATNATGALRGLQPALMSMDDIFIRAVGAGA